MFPALLPLSFLAKGLAKPSSFGKNHCRPRLEALEDRYLPAIFSIMSLPAVAAFNAPSAGAAWGPEQLPSLGDPFGQGLPSPEVLQGIVDIANLPEAAIDTVFGDSNGPADPEGESLPGWQTPTRQPAGAIGAMFANPQGQASSDAEGNTIETHDPKDPDGIESLAPEPQSEAGTNTIEYRAGGYRVIEDTTVGHDGEVRGEDVRLYDRNDRQRGENLYNGEGQLVFSQVTDPDGEAYYLRRGPGWIEQPNENVDGPMDWRGLTPGRDETNNNGPSGPLVDPADVEEVQVDYQVPNAFYRRLWATDPDENGLSGSASGGGSKQTSDFMQPPSGGPGGPGLG